MEENATAILEASTGDWRSRLAALLDDYRKRPRPATSRERFGAAIAWQSELVDAGLAAPGWPSSVGGMALSLEDQLDYYRMTTEAGAPKHPCGLSFIVAPTIIVHGTQEQKDRFLEPLLRADEFWCQGFSEPGAGSDLASLSTRAVRDGDNYRVTGQKIWTTMADKADWIFTLVRTGPPGRGTSGITYLLIPMNSPGIEVRPLRDAAGGYHFAEVFFDDVVVPVANRVGEEGGGWSIMRTSLGHERATAFLADEFRYRSTVDKVFRLAAEQGYAADPLVRQELAKVETSVREIAANSARALDAVLRNEDPGGVASVNRLVKSEFEQHMHRLALRLTGSAAVLNTRSEGVVENGRWSYGYLMARAATIGAGTAEIQRNTIAENVLGLPSHRGEGRRDPVVAPGRPLTAPDEDEAALREVLGDLVSSYVDTEKLLARESTPGDYDIGLWDELVKFGLPGLSAPDSLGGGGQPLRLLCAAVETVAYHLGPVPLVPTAITLEVLVAAGAEGVARAIINGATATFVVPVDDKGWVTDSGLPVLDGGRLTGRVERVAGGPVADVLVVLATDAATGDRVLVSVQPTDVTVTVQNSVDLTATVAIVTANGAPATVLAEGESVDNALTRARRVAQLLVAADSVGVANRALAMAVDWAGQREQFGQPIGSYQAISHRCAYMLVGAEGARGQVLSAADRTADDPDRSTASNLATAAALDAALDAAEGCIQIHGGIGFTWEHPAHLLLRRATANQAWIGRPHVLRDRAVGEVFERLH
ncbi:acyl-CoA dehydrogenase family protein [Rhodococcus sp. NPDC003382]|uniref:acyl-CoA dehydrogenase family protein n=1 Tax=Rhodococcus sp. HM1 TaxID=2937759 RepID=UPI00200A84DE|nr:acyl-CoA dehydrogenase family protein [Rhodococcus sp. HM1]MCK8669753.1 acyl-CoA dehydrogenase family protein [Rhodococcus sp. HM1]